MEPPVSTHGSSQGTRGCTLYCTYSWAASRDIHVISTVMKLSDPEISPFPPGCVRRGKRDSISLYPSQISPTTRTSSQDVILQKHRGKHGKRHALLRLPSQVSNITFPDAQVDIVASVIVTRSVPPAWVPRTASIVDIQTGGGGGGWLFSILLLIAPHP